MAPNRGPWQVYDIRDRTEQNNLASRHQTLVEQLSAQYRKWAAENHAERHSPAEKRAYAP